MNDQECKAFQEYLIHALSPFAVPLLVAPDIKLEPNNLVNGSGCLVQCHGCSMLVTCFHVWEHLQENEGAILVLLLGDGYEAVHVNKPSLIASDQDRDLAIFDLQGLGNMTQKRWFQLGPDAIYHPNNGDILVGLGFPGMWRQSSTNRSTFRFGALPFVVGDSTCRYISIAENDVNNREVFEYLDSQFLANASKDSCGGLSGGPAFFITPERKIKLSGFVSHRGSGALFLSTATGLQELIQTPNGK